MKKLFLFAITLCTCATLFYERDTIWQRGWGRDVEPYLSDVRQWHPCSKKPPQLGRIVEEVQCEGEPIPSSEPCAIDSARAARRALAAQPHCIDRAIETLRKEAPETDAKATSDLAAALLVRAQRHNDPADLLDALEQADTAVQADGALPQARFNRALILETLELTQAAMTAWDSFVEVGKGEPRAEAIRRRDALKNRVWHQRQWAIHERNLSSALRARDRATVRKLITPYASAAGRYFEETLLLQWAEEPTTENLAQLRLFADVFLEQFRDRFASDTVDAIERASPAKLSSLREGHRMVAEAQRLRHQFRRADAAPLFLDAVTLLGDSPFASRARLASQTESVIATADAQKYRHLLARAQWTKAQLLSVPNHIGAVTSYIEALNTYKTLRDEEGLTAIHTRLSGVYRQLGDVRRAWDEAYYSRRHRRRLMEINDHNAQALEMALAARDLGHPQIALLYLDEAVTELDAIDTRRDEELPPDLATNLAATLRHRAALRLQTADTAGARADVARLLVLGKSDKRAAVDDTIRQWLDARMDELLAHESLVGSAGALPRLNAALANTSEAYHSIRASLFVQRAGVYADLNQPDNQEKDLLSAIAILEKEGAEMLAARDPSDPVEIWRHYFNRFQDAYRMLIQLYQEQGDAADAFAYAERARAAEPLYRVGGQPATVDELSRELDPGTYIVEYVVLDNKSYVWIVGREFFRSVEVAGKEEIRKLSDDLQAAFVDNDRGRARSILSDAYKLLLADAWKLITEKTQEPRLVIVPDGLLHGMPFAAFRNPDGRYLIENAVVEISGSAALYLHSLRRDRKIPFRPRPTLLAIGDPEFDTTLPYAEGLGQLKHAKSEVGQIRDGYMGEPLIGANGTVEAFRAGAPDADVIHVAAHGRVYSDEAVLLLAKTPKHRGVLTAHDLAALKLDRTRLVLFSACESAGGLPIGAEGLAPLVHPIITAGVPGVVGTLWSIKDNATTEDLMVSFHAQYRKGSDAAESLRQAQLLAIAQQKSVEAWAAFQVIGHASSPFARAPARGGTSIDRIHSPDSLQRPDRLRSQ